MASVISLAGEYRKVATVSSCQRGTMSAKAAQIHSRPAGGEFFAQQGTLPHRLGDASLPATAQDLLVGVLP